jgi:hypothetical protein
MALLAASAQAQFTLYKLDLSEHPMATCLDGTPGGYYIAPGTGSGANKWVIHTQGGGECVHATGSEASLSPTHFLSSPCPSHASLPPPAPSSLSLFLSLFSLSPSSLSPRLVRE